VRLARERAPGAEVVLGSADQLPFRDESFTAIAMSIVFFFLRNPITVLCECRRVLTLGGRLALYTTSPALRGTPAAPEPLASRGHFYEDEELAELARQAGLTAVTTTAASCSWRARRVPASRQAHRRPVPFLEPLERPPAVCETFRSRPRSQGKAAHPPSDAGARTWSPALAGDVPVLTTEGTYGHLAPQASVIAQSACRCISSISFFGRRPSRSMPTSHIASTMTGWTRSARSAPADSARTSGGPLPLLGG
jgi:Methyltransferase domain